MAGGQYTREGRETDRLTDRNKVPEQNALISRLDCIGGKIPSKSFAFKNAQSSRFVTPRSINFVITMSTCSSSSESSVLLILCLTCSMVDCV